MYRSLIAAGQYAVQTQGHTDCDGRPDAAGMSKAWLVITAVTIEKRPVREVARSSGVARSWVYALLARYEAEGRRRIVR
jgi:hypothetical protein